jgi:hypothetical protein
VNPFARALEILGISMSQNNWTYISIGDNTTRSFALMYSILPFASAAGMVWSIINFKNDDKYIASVALFGAYFLGFSRAFGRHSLIENQYDIVVWSSVLAFMFMFAAMRPKICRQAFIFVGVSLMIFFGASNPLDYKSLLNRAYATSINADIYRDGPTERISRIDLSAPLATHDQVISMINTFVPRDETYMDLTSQTLLYALTGREKPVYVNHSPLHLSGEYTQRRFIAQIEDFGDKCNFALLGGRDSLDFLWTQYRYYLVYEYLYANFRPLVKSSDNFYLWVRKDKYDSYASLLANLDPERTDFAEPLLGDDPAGNDPANAGSNTEPSPSSSLFFSRQSAGASSLIGAKKIYGGSAEADVVGVEYDDQRIRIEIDADVSLFDDGITAVYGEPNGFIPLDYSYRDSDYHTYDLGELPYIWGMYDERKAWENTAVALDDERVVPKDRQSGANYVLLTIDADIQEKSFFSLAEGTSAEEFLTTNDTASLALLTPGGDVLATYFFNLHRGSNRYIFRVSSDWYWNNGSDLRLAVQSKSDLRVKFQLLLGD